MLNRGFPQGAVAVAAHAGDNLSQAAVGGVGDPGPGDAVGVKIRDGAPEDGVVHQGGQEVVRRCYGVGVAGEVDVNSSSGTTRAAPPPVPPPLMPKIGPRVGSRSVATTRCPSRPSP